MTDRFFALAGKLDAHVRLEQLDAAERTGEAILEDLPPTGQCSKAISPTPSLGCSKSTASD